MQKNVSLLRRIGAVMAKLLIMFGITLGLVETGLRLLDPTGVYVWQVNLHLLANAAEWHETGYQFPEGELSLLGYTVHTNADTTRNVPDAVADGGCTIAAVGDSVTFGMGVDDAETWVNLVARAYADDGVGWLNTGRPNYNSANAVRQVAYFEADGYVYLHIYNDNQGTTWDRWRNSREGDNPWQPALHYYLQHILNSGASFAADRDNFSADRQNNARNTALSPADALHRESIATLAARADVLIVAVANDPLLARLPEDTATIRPSTDPLSPVDGHPNVAGNQQIAEDMLSVVEDFVKERCDL